MRSIASTALLVLALLVAVAMSGCISGAGTAAPSAIATAAATATATPVPSCCDSNNPKAGLGDLPGYSLTVTGGKVSPLTLTYADLKAMDFVVTGNVSKMNMHGDGVQMTASYAGVPVSAILARAGVPDGNASIHISAPDGYSMDYSRAQLDGAIIGLVVNGEPAVTDMDSMNSIVLVMPGQRGPLWVKVPANIEIVNG